MKLEALIHEQLKDPNFAAEYLADAVRQTDIDSFLLAVRRVIDARGGMTKISRELKSLHRVSLYKALSRGGNPLFITMLEILHVLGIGLMPYAREAQPSRNRRKKRA